MEKLVSLDGYRNIKQAVERADEITRLSSRLVRLSGAEAMLTYGKGLSDETLYAERERCLLGLRGSVINTIMRLAELNQAGLAVGIVSLTRSTVREAIDGKDNLLKAA